jgi:23S rRNA (uracil1939-C5)-methyltransferase
VEILIEQQIYGGAGLGHLSDGKVVLSPFTIESELVSLEEIYEKNNTQTAIPHEILRRSEHRIEAPCPYYGICGGCQYQHIKYQHQLTIKREILNSQMERLAGLKHLPIEDTIPSKNSMAYRNHVQLHLDPDGHPGFQKALSHEVIPVEKCLILEETLNELLKTMAFEPSSELERVAIRDDQVGIPLVYLNGKSNNPPEFEVDFPLNVVYRGPAGEILLSGDGYNLFEIKGKSFQVSSGSFFQTNRDIAGAMVDLLLKRTPENNDVIMDLYCGAGFFSSFLAERTGKLVGIESSESACNDFAVNLDMHDHVELYQGNVEDILPELDVHPDLVVVDPPRAGIAQKAIKSLMNIQPARLVYISCDPSTLARDLKFMHNAGYMVESMVPLDMFPQTYHIETMVFLMKD